MKDTRSRIDHLRQRAEQALARGVVSPAAIERVDIQDLGALLHELQTFQAELEIQNLELHEAQEVSETATRRYRLLFGSLPVPVLVVDKRGMIQEANHQAARVFGLDGPDSQLEKSILRLIDADGQDNERLLALLQNGTDPRAGAPLALSMVAADGPQIPMEVFVSPLPATFHADRHHLLICLDVSLSEEAEGLRAAKQEADQALAQLREAEAVAAIGHWTIELATNRLEASEQIYRIHGWSVDGAADIDRFVGAIHPDDVESVIAAWRQAHGRREVYSAEYRIGKGDRVRWVRERADFSREMHGKVVGTLLDITEHRELEDQLRKQQQRLKAILDGTHAGTWEWNVQTGESRLNERWAEIIGYTLSELAPFTMDHWTARVHPEDLPRALLLLEEHLTGQSPHYDCEVRLRHKQGHWVWVHDHGRVSRWGPDGKPLLMSGIELDISLRKQSEQQSAELLSRLQKLGSQLPGFVYQFQLWPNGSSALVYASSGIRDIFDVEPETVRHDASALFERIRETDVAGVHASIGVSAANLSVWKEVFGIHHPKKGLLFVEGHATPDRQPDGSTIWHGYIQDITDRKQAEQEVKEARSMLHAALTNSPSAMLIVSAPDGRIRFANRAAEALEPSDTGSGSDLTGTPYTEHARRLNLRRHDGVPIAIEELPLIRAIQGGEIVDAEEAMMDSGQGAARWFSISSAPIRDDENRINAGIVVCSDITQQKVVQLQLQRSAHCDALTGLPNRVLLADRLDQAMARARRSQQQLAVGFIDLDHFKPVNDAYGHSVGDRLLILLAQRMRETLRDVDTLARLGGDEFVVVLSDLAEQTHAHAMVERLLEAMAAPVYADGLRLQVTGSIGLSFYPQETELDASQLLRQADQAMYRAKLQGRNAWHAFDG